MNRVFLLLLLLIASSCKKEKEFVTIHNPTDEIIIVNFDNTKEIEVAPNSASKRKVPFGSISIQVNNQKIVDVHLESGYKYLINPSLENLYIQTIGYYANEEGKRNFLANHKFKNFFINEIEIEGNYEVIKNKLVIAKKWDYGINETYPKSTSKIPFEKKYSIVKKICSEQQVIKAIYNNQF